MVPIALVDPIAQLSSGEARRYARHITIPEFGQEGQQRLKRGRVLCVGAGGLGSPILMYLAAAGVGTIGIIDFDTVDESNLQRQIAHGQSDLGRPKTESARDTILEINPHTVVHLHPEALTSDNALGFFARYDLVIDGSDNFPTRYLINDAAVLSHKPYVWGAVHRFQGQASVFWADHGPCYRCLYPQPPDPGDVPSCAESGVLGVVCASIGAIQATEAIKLLVGIGTPLLGSLLLYDALSMTHRTFDLPKNPDCPVCGPAPTITELTDLAGACPNQAGAGILALTAEQLSDRLEAGSPICLVDTREPEQYRLAHLPRAIHVPARDLLNGDGLHRLPRQLPVVVYCQSGARSAVLVSALRQAGFDEAVHLDGGILAWSQRIDPAMPVI